jgi:CRISPR-associated exonuclease Cas4
LYKEDEFLQLSGIQHFAFCRRQWALAYIEMQWAENLRTVEGKILHNKAHEKGNREKRGDLIITRAMPVHSRELGISGECDVVEFHRSEKGISVFGWEGNYQVIPIEYKRGKPKENDSDRLQLTAQAMCLEEMLCCEISDGYLFYGEMKHRVKVIFDTKLRQKVSDLFAEMHQYFERGHTPQAKRTKACNACSLKDICLPVLEKKKSAAVYMEQIWKEADIEKTT